MTYPILEFDPSRPALIEPTEVLKPLPISPYCVLCFFREVIETIVASGRSEQVAMLGSEIGPNPAYQITVDGRQLVVCHPGVGGPLAAGFLEELIALGCRYFVVCGGAGAVDGRLTLGHVVVPLTAIRDEGTSYHYLPPGREVAASPAGVQAIETILQRDHVPYVTGKTWTTDAIYRETPSKIAHRRAEGALTVEMEAASLFAVAQFRQVNLAQILYAGDDVSSDSWDSRHWQRQTSLREKLFWLAAEACLEMG